MDGKVALVTGAARGQGRSHALTLAEAGAEVIALDICKPVNTVHYDLASPEDLMETASQIEALDRRVVAREADVRDADGLAAVVDDAVQEFGGIDVVCANAGIASFGSIEDLTIKAWQDMIDINLSGVYYTVRAANRHLRDGGSVILTGSTAGLKGFGNLPHYVAAKHGVVGLTKALAIELAPRRIRVNSIHPTQVQTDMITNVGSWELFRPDLEHPTQEDFVEASREGLLLDHVGWLQPRDVSNAVLFLASDESEFITGVALPVDAGWLTK